MSVKDNGNNYSWKKIIHLCHTAYIDAKHEDLHSMIVYAGNNFKMFIDEPLIVNTKYVSTSINL